MDVPPAALALIPGLIAIMGIIKMFVKNDSWLKVIVTALGVAGVFALVNGSLALPEKILFGLIIGLSAAGLYHNGWKPLKEGVKKIPGLLCFFMLCLAVCFSFSCTRFVVEFEATPTENGEEEITVTKVISWGAVLVGRSDNFTIEKTIDKEGAASFWVQRNTEENAREQQQIVATLLSLISTMYAAQAPVQAIE